MLEVWELFQKGGIVMYPLLLCSVVSVYIFVERIVYYKQIGATEAWINALEDVLKKGQREEAMKLAEQSQSDAAIVVKEYLESDQYRTEKAQTLETRANVLVGAYEERLNFMSIIITLAPLLGLLGTILGIVSAFQVFDNRGAGQPFAVTAGIGEALVATAFGLLVAILTLILYGVLKHYISKLQKQMEQCCLALLASEK